MDRLDGKVAVVTGGGSGIGRAIVHEFAAVGMPTVVADVEGDKAEAVAEEARLLGTESLAVICDVADYSSVVDLADAVQDFSGVLAQGFAGEGHAHRPQRAIEQGRRIKRFQVAQVLRNRRLADAHGRGGLRHLAVFGDGDENFQRTQ